MDTRRLILFSIFLLSCLLLWQNWQAFNKPPTALVTSQSLPAKEAPNDTPIPTPSLTGQSPPAKADKMPAFPPAETSNGSGESFTVTMDRFAATLSTEGGNLIGMSLFEYKDREDKQKNFAYFDPRHAYAAQSGLIGDGLPTHRTRFKRVAGPLQLEAGQDELRLRLEADTHNGIKVAKIFTFRRGSYLVDVTWEVVNGSDKPIPAAHAYYQLQRDDVKPEDEVMMSSTFTGPAIYTDADKYQKISFEDIAKGKAKFTKMADNGWLALVQHYFVTAWVPENQIEREFYVRKVNDRNLYQAGLILPLPEIAPSGRIEKTIRLYAGPQEQSVLEKITPGLALVVDYGWLTIIAAPIFWVLGEIHKLVGNWGWAIIILTILIKLIFFPLSAASYKSMAKMRVLTPRLMQLKERYADDKQKLNQEMMKLYQTEKINPLGGCLPILVQIPVFIALYWVLLGAVEMRGAPWLGWITDLAAPDPYFILPVIMIVSMIVQMRLNPTPPDPIQAKVMMAMPFIFGIMFLWFPSGLVLYWVVNNLLSIAQQWQITRLIEEKKQGKAANDDA